MDDFLSPEERRAQRREEKAVKAKQAQDDSIIQSIMASEAGRGWAHDLLELCGVFRITFTGEALQSAFNEGQRNVGLRLLVAIMRACPDAYVQMMKEQNDGRRADSDADDGTTDPYSDGDA